MESYSTVFCDWLLSFSIRFFSKFHLCYNICQHLTSFFLERIFPYLFPYLFIHSLVGRLLGWLLLSDNFKWCYCNTGEESHLISPDNAPRIELLDDMDSGQAIAKLLPALYVPSSNVWVFFLLDIVSTSVSICLFAYSRPVGYQAVKSLEVWLAFPWQLITPRTFASAHWLFVNIFW